MPSPALPVPIADIAARDCGVSGLGNARPARLAAAAGRVRNRAPSLNSAGVAMPYLSG
jgi:hypothetical protein